MGVGVGRVGVGRAGGESGRGANGDRRGEQELGSPRPCHTNLFGPFLDNGGGKARLGLGRRIGQGRHASVAKRRAGGE